MAKAYVLRLAVSIGSGRLLDQSFPESIHPALARSSENVGAPTFKVILEGYLVITKVSNGFSEVLEGKQLAFAIRMASFPK
jgi:hypothetical protein